MMGFALTTYIVLRLVSACLLEIYRSLSNVEIKIVFTSEINVVFNVVYKLVNAYTVLTVKEFFFIICFLEQFNI